MEFHENRARQPFIGFVFLARIIKNGGFANKHAEHCSE